MSTLRPCVAITAAAAAQLLAQLLGRECAAIKPGFPCLSLVPPQRPRNDPINRLIERKWGLLSSGAAAPARAGGFEPGFVPHRPKATRFRATGSGFHALWAELTAKIEISPMAVRPGRQNTANGLGKYPGFHFSRHSGHLGPSLAVIHRSPFRLSLDASHPFVDLPFPSIIPFR